MHISFYNVASAAANVKLFHDIGKSRTDTVDVTSTGADPAADFEGSGDSGTYSFAWENDGKTASVNFDVTTSGNGTAQMIVRDSKGDEVLNETRPSVGNDTFAGTTSEGKKGTWLITLVLTNFNGDGSYSVHSGS